MKATGIVRRIDELGRVVIPKEIRRTLRIRESDPLEIYTGNNGEVIFKKYSVMAEIAEFALQYTDILSKTLKAPVLISNRDRIVAVSGISKREFLERRITNSLEDLMESRNHFSMYETKNKIFKAVEGMPNESSLIFPIIVAGDVLGSIIVFKNEEKSISQDISTALVKISAELLSKNLED